MERKPTHRGLEEAEEKSRERSHGQGLSGIADSPKRGGVNIIKNYGDAKAGGERKKLPSGVEVGRKKPKPKAI